MSPTKSWAVGLLLTVLATHAFSPPANGETWKAPSESWQTPARTESSSSALKWQQRVLNSPAVKQEPVVEQPPAAPAERSGYRTARLSSTHYSPSDMHGDSWEAPQRDNRPRMRLASTGEPEVIPPGITQYEPITEHGEFAEGCGGCGGCDDCAGPCFDSPCGEACDFGYECFDGRCSWWIKNLTVFGGGQGFKGPVDWGTNGNFGFHEGLGISGPLGDPWGHGYQLGARFVQSNFSGTTATAPGTDRSQYFVTAGVFRRNLCQGFQWGVVWDYMHDRYYDTFNLGQIRTDISYSMGGCGDIGFMGTFGVKKDNYTFGNFQNIELDPTDMYALYFRKTFENGGEGRLWGGATGRGDGLVGADLWVPISHRFAIQNTINYKIPKEGRAGGAAQADESWGVSISLVWYPGKTALCQRCNPYRPLQNIADNATFMVDQIIH